MERIKEIMEHPTYIAELENIQQLEKNREFCKHNMSHFLDVARIAYLLCLERGVVVLKDVIYAAGLLHDIGRGKQYEEKIKHPKASKVLAEEILKESSFNDDERTYIFHMIEQHGKKSKDLLTLMDRKNLITIFQQADQLSRPCFSCEAQQKCDWKQERKNAYIQY